MTDLSQTLAANSDQMNADDLLAGPRDCVIKSVMGREKKDQPVDIFMEGLDVPWRPCLTMRRALVAIWGKDGKAYKGRRLRLYRDEDVMYGGIKVGGIRISHASDIPGPYTLMLSASRGKKAKIVIEPLDSKPANDAPANSNTNAPKWRLSSDGLHKYEYDGDATSDAALRALYSTLMRDFNAGRQGGRGVEIARMIYEANKKFIEDHIPKKGRAALMEVYRSLPLAEAGEPF